MLKNKFEEQRLVQKFAPPYPCIFMDELETRFIQSQSLQLLVWFRNINDISFIWTHGKDKPEKFLDDLNSFDNIKFIYYRYRSTPVFSLQFLSSRSYQKIDYLQPKSVLLRMTFYDTEMK